MYKNALFIILAIITTVYAYDLSSREARTAIASMPEFKFDPDRVRIRKITPGYSGDIVEAEISATFRLEKRDGEWRAADIRLGDRHWEDLELINTAIRNEKIKRTRDRLTALADAIERYRKEHGYNPRAGDIFQLSELLSPRYINPVYREDLWQNPLRYLPTTHGYSITSAGPDRQFGNEDDLKVEK